MTTRTQLQTHFGRLRDLALQPSQPLKPTFWDNLDPDGRKASVNQERSWEFNNESAWDPIGSVKDEWNDSIYPRTIKPLLQHNTKKIYHGVKKQTPYSVCCWMIGPEWHSSHPAAIIICGNNKVTKNAVKLIERHGELARAWGFRVYGYESKISLTMGDSASEFDGVASLCAISGTRFTVGGEHKISTRTATLGGSIMIDGEIFGVTVAHPFLEVSQGESSDSHESDMSDDDSDNDSDFPGSVVCSDTTESTTAESVMLESNVAVVEDPISHQHTILGSIPNQSQSEYFSQATDWALLKLQPAALAINLLTLSDKLVIPRRIRQFRADEELWVAVNPVESVRAKSSPSICGLFVPSSGMQDVWALGLKPAPGYCGSWVVNAPKEAIYGVIVAGSEANHISYALPACNIFDQIQARFPSMKLQSLWSIATLPGPQFGNMIRKAKELGLTQFVSKVVSARPQLGEKDSSGFSPLCLAIQEGDETVVASLLEGGVSPEFIGTPSELRPLALAVRKGHMANVKLLLSFGADPNSLSGGSQPKTPLMIAAIQGHRELTRLLIASGSRVNTSDTFGSSPLAVAARYGDEEVIRILIASGATVDAKDNNGRHTPLMEAVIAHKEKATKVLLENGANVNYIDDFGYTPLYLAAKFGDAASTRLLLEWGASQFVRPQNRDTPLIIAAKKGHDQVVQVLLDHQKYPDFPNGTGDTPLMMAVTRGHGSTVAILLRYGADIHTSNLAGDTPWSLAQQDSDMTKLLRDYSVSQDYKGKRHPLVNHGEPPYDTSPLSQPQELSLIGAWVPEKKQK